jgi:hypothetical protein
MAAEPKRPSEANDRLKTQIATSFLSGLVQLSAPAVVSLLSSPPQSQKTPPAVRAPTSLLFPAHHPIRLLTPNRALTYRRCLAAARQYQSLA